VSRARLVTAAVAWPAGPPRDTATKLQGQLAALQDALRAENVQAAKGPVHDVHETEHDLSAAVYGWLGNLTGQAPSTSGAADHGNMGTGTGQGGMNMGPGH
jgi:hypothetical protein